MFNETCLPLNLSFASRGGPERHTQIVTLASGGEVRNGSWQDSRRRYDLAGAIQSQLDLDRLIAFFEACRGRLYGFRFYDPIDHSSAAADQTMSSQNQLLGYGDGTSTEFQLVKIYGTLFQPWQRTITKPRGASVTVAIDGSEQASGTDFLVDETTGQVTIHTAPSQGAVVTAGFEFDVPVRFDTDHLSLTMNGVKAGQVTSVPIVEILS
jgi:uncharacterized protein (TIGR02217 family)